MNRALFSRTLCRPPSLATYLARAAAAGLSWPLPAVLTDAVLEALLFVKAGAPTGTRRKSAPDWPTLHRELRRPGVTLMLLWQEYRQGEPQGYGYSRFCELYGQWESCRRPCGRCIPPASGSSSIMPARRSRWPPIPDRRSSADQFLNLSASPAAMHESILRAEGVEKTFATVSAGSGCGGSDEVSL